MNRFARIAAACAVALVCMPSRAHAAPAALTVPSLATAPTLDPQAPANAGGRSGPPLALAWDVIHGGPAGEPTAVRVASDGHFLYVRFDAEQREPVVATQHSNDTSPAAAAAATTVP